MYKINGTQDSKGFEISYAGEYLITVSSLNDADIFIRQFNKVIKTMKEVEECSQDGQ